jgi:integrase
MPKRAAELSAFQVSRIRKPGEHRVGGVSGLFLDYRGKNSKSWILRAELNGKRPTLGLGSFPEVSLADARATAREWKALMRKGIDPRDEKRKAKAKLRAESLVRLKFSEAAVACWKSKAKVFKNPKHAAQWKSTLEEYAFPVLGELYPEDIETGHVLKVLEPIWSTLTDTATKVRGRIEAVISYAFALRQLRHLQNAARWKDNLDQLLPSARKLIRLKKEHHPRVPWQRMPIFWAKLKAKQGMGARMLEFAILTTSRDKEVRGAKWQEFDLDAKCWRVPAGRMKGNLAHDVPLSSAAIDLLKALPRMVDCDYVFWGRNGKKQKVVSMLSNGAMGKVLDDMHEADAKAGGIGFKDPDVDRVATPHGTARSSFKDWSRNCASYADEVSELCLAHVASDETRVAYARDQLMPLRMLMLEEYALFLVTPPIGNGNIIPLASKRAINSEQAAAA